MLNIKKNIYLDRNKVKIISNSFLFSSFDKSAIEQLYGVSSLPNIYKEAIGFPDLHVGYGVPIGSAFATSLDNSPIISPEAVGFDINCGVSLVKTPFFGDDIKDKEYSLLLKALLKLPIGLSSEGLKITKQELFNICYEGVKWAHKNNYANKFDKYHIDNKGILKDASVSYLSKEAISRGLKQVGTLGEGNHFIDLLFVDDLFDKSFCKKHKVSKNQLLIMLHSGSRGFGHQVATDYIKLCKNKKPFSYFDFYSKEGQEYYKSMCAASNFAFVNRLVLRTKVIDTITNTLNLGREDFSFSLLYDLTHNNASLETHDKKKLIVHRKGAVRCNLSKDLPSSSPFFETGTPMVLPGSMLDSSYVLLPKPKVETETLSTIVHGCGRLLSRKKAKENVSASALKEELLRKKIFVSGHSENTLREEQPKAYKPSKEVVDSLVGAGLCKKAFSLKPKLVVTG